MDPEWVIDIRNQCLAARVAFFFKQWGGRSPKAGGRLLEGREWNQFPAKSCAVDRRAFELTGI
jgi:protein gp37